MKKEYIRPELHVEQLDTETLISSSPNQVYDKVGSQQFVNSNNWNEEVTDIWGNSH